MTERVYEISLERTFAAPRLTVWGLVSDTNRWDRASGLTPGKYSWQEHEGQRVRVCNAVELGFDIEWIEPPYEWVEGRFVHGARRFLKGPVARGGFHARLRDAEGGATIVTAVAYVAGDGALMPVLGRVMQRRFRIALDRYFNGLSDVITNESPQRSSQPRSSLPQRQSATMTARDLIAERPYDALTQGPRSETSRSELERRAARVRDVLVGERALVDRVVHLLAERPDEEVAQMRPFELADRWQVDRRQLLRVFLHGTRAGLCDLRWQINCPVCRVAAQVVGMLADVTGNVHCAACNIGYDVDFGKHVEAVFQCHPAIRTVETSVYCASSPSFLPHVLAQLSVEPNQTRSEPTELRAGSYRLRLLAGRRSADVELAANTSLHVTIAGDAMHVTTTATDADASLRLESTHAQTSVVLVERGGADGSAVLGSVVASFPDFLDLFATEAPATGVELSIAHLALLFSDLTGSTALYQSVGDARAFAIVQEHFTDMANVVAEHGGAIVKTMGDAVMATFPSEVDAIKAAVAMTQRCRDHHGALGLGAKLGVYAGACLAVRANDRLDFFGTTVNLAARLQAQAEGGQLVITAEQAQQPDVKSLLTSYAQTPFKAHLKGIASEQDLLAVNIC